MTTVTTTRTRKRRTRRRGKKVSKPVKEYVKKAILREQEIKYIYKFNTGGTAGPLRPDTAPLDATRIGVLNEMQQGTSGLTRIGDRIRVRRIQIWFKMDAVMDAANIRMMLIRDRKPNGALPTSALIFENSTLADVNPVYAMYNEDQIPSRFTILKDKVYTVNVYGGATDRIEKKIYHWDIRLKHPKPTIYSGNAGTIADILENSYLLAWMSDWPAAAGSRPNLFINYKMHYEDL